MAEGSHRDAGAEPWQTGQGSGICARVAEPGGALLVRVEMELRGGGDRCESLAPLCDLAKEVGMQSA